MQTLLHATTGVGVGLGVGVAQIQVDSPVQLGFRHTPLEQVIDDGQSLSIAQPVPHCGTGVGVGVTVGVGVGLGDTVGVGVTHAF